MNPPPLKSPMSSDQGGTIVTRARACRALGSGRARPPAPELADSECNESSSATFASSEPIATKKGKRIPNKKIPPQEIGRNSNPTAGGKKGGGKRTPQKKITPQEKRTPIACKMCVCVCVCVCVCMCVCIHAYIHTCSSVHCSNILIPWRTDADLIYNTCYMR